MSAKSKEVYIEEEIEAPECFAFYDDLATICRRCPIQEECESEQAATRPPCFGVEWEECFECSSCLVSSDCAETLRLSHKEASKMTARRKVRIRRPVQAEEPEEDFEDEEEAEEEEAPRKAATRAKPAPPKPPVRRRKSKAKPKPKPEPEEEEEEEEEGEDYTRWTVRELREELKDREMDTAGRKSELIKRLMADDAGELAAEELEEAEEEEEVSEALVTTLEEMFAAMDEGYAVTITRLSKTKYQMVTGTAVIAPTVVRRGNALKGMVYWEEVLSEDYWNFDYNDCGDGSKRGWSDLSAEERTAYAEELGIELDEERPKIYAMKLKTTVLDELGIEKYKEEYQSRTARKAVREGDVAPKYVGS